MFDSVGWGEIIVLALAALFIFGPERLPDLAKEAAAGLKKARSAITGVRAQMDESLGEDLSHLRHVDLREYPPRTFIRDQLLGDDDAPPVRREGATGVAAAASSARDAGRPRDAGTPPPFDVDAT